MRKFDWLKRACAALVLCLATAIVLPAQTFTSLYKFDGTNGGAPAGVLVQGNDGNLYGTTAKGGASGEGTVFQITPTGTLTKIYDFCSQTGCTDGSYPYSGVIQAADGNLYGATYFGGANDPPNGGGTLFKITPSGALTTLYNFCSQSGCPDGVNPRATLVQVPDGSFYGSTEGGGSYNRGTFFKVTPSGSLTTLYSFCSQSGCPDGQVPEGEVIQAADGNFYGTTAYGGANLGTCYGEGCGTVFKITPGGALATLYSFCSQTNCADGAEPFAGLMLASDGSFYGTTYSGGGTNGYEGTVFKITPAGTLATLYTFCSQTGCPDGQGPEGGLIQATDGNLYGTTAYGGSTADGEGTIFKITPSGTLTTLFSFCSQKGCAQTGEIPAAALVEDTNGKFYGTAISGGGNGASCNSQGCGTVFDLSVGLAPFVKIQTTSGRIGSPVKILGTNLTGVTSVTFNGTPAVFRVGSPYLIMATVPTGATTGKVQVITPGGTLSSNVLFRVRP